LSSTNFNTAYDLIVTRIAALLPNHIRLSDPYNPEQNPERYLEQGWGLALNLGGSNTSRFVTSQKTTNIQYQVIISRKRFALDLDAASKANTDKNLLEDLRVIITDIWDNNFNISGSPLIKFVDYSGINQVKTEKNSYMYVGLNINVEYFIF